MSPQDEGTARSKKRRACDWKGLASNRRKGGHTSKGNRDSPQFIQFILEN